MDPLENISDSDLEVLVERLADPVWFAQNVIGVEPWSKQKELLYAVRDHDRVAVRSGHKVGKALALDTFIPTPAGPRVMGELRVGDYVYDGNGNPTDCRHLTRVY